VDLKDVGNPKHCRACWFRLAGALAREFAHPRAQELMAEVQSRLAQESDEVCRDFWLLFNLIAIKNGTLNKFIWGRQKKRGKGKKLTARYEAIVDKKRKRIGHMGSSPNTSSAQQRRFSAP
jgi:hypothetical protein